MPVNGLLRSIPLLTPVRELGECMFTPVHMGALLDLLDEDGKWPELITYPAMPLQAYTGGYPWDPRRTLT